MVDGGLCHALGAPVHGVELAGPQQLRVAQFGVLDDLAGGGVEPEHGVAVGAHREPVEAAQGRVARAAEGVEVARLLGHGDVGVLGVLEHHPHAVGVVVDGVVMVHLGRHPERVARHLLAGRGGKQGVLADEVQRSVVVGRLGAVAAVQHLGLDVVGAVADDDPVAGLGDGVDRLRDDRIGDGPGAHRSLAVPAHDVELAPEGVDRPHDVAVGVDHRMRGAHHERQQR